MSNTISFKVYIDTEAALLRGEIVDKEAIVEIDADTLKAMSQEERKEMLKYRNADGSFTLGYTKLEFATVDAVIAVFKQKAEKEVLMAQQKKEEEERVAAELAAELDKFEAQVNEFVATNPGRGLVSVTRTGSIGTVAKNETDYTIEAWLHFPQVPQFRSWRTPPRDVAIKRDALNEKVRKHTQQFRDENAALVASKADEIAAYYAAQDAQKAIEAEKKKAEQQAQLIKIAAKRLETGYWKRTWLSYNARRFSKPWAAKCQVVQGKLNYIFSGNFAGDDDGGDLSIACAPGEIIAWGQKDYRGESELNIQIMKADGIMQNLTRAEAVGLLSKPVEKRDIPEGVADELTRRLNALRVMNNANVIDDLKD